MEKIISKAEEGKVLHLIHRLEDFDTRTEVIEENNFLQCASLKLPLNKTFRPHRHITKERHYKEQIAQESWVIIRGKVKAFFYDLDDKLLTTRILNQGDASFTLYGGHTYEILEDNTLVYEYKTGPYEGQKLDKVFID